MVVAAACDDNTPSGNHDLSVNFDLASPPTATVLTTTDTLTNCIAVDATSIYWTESSATSIPDAGSLSRLMRVSKGGGTPMLMVDAIDSPGCAVIDSASAYVTRGSTILQVPLNGSGATPLATEQHVLPGSTPRLAAGGGFVYWITDVYGAIDAYNGMNALVRMPTSGGGSVETLFTDLVGSPGGIAIDATNAYYSDQSGVYARPLAGGAAVPIGVSALHNNRFAIDEMNLALVEVGGIGAGDIAVSKLDGSGRTVVFPKLATALAIDDSGVYANAAGVLTRFALDGSKTTTLDPSGPRAIALDATEIYFTDGASILRLAK